MEGKEKLGTAERQARVLDMTAQGATLVSMAKLLGVSVTTIRRDKDTIRAPDHARQRETAESQLWQLLHATFASGKIRDYVQIYDRISSLWPKQKETDSSEQWEAIIAEAVAGMPCCPTCGAIDVGEPGEEDAESS